MSLPDALLTRLSQHAQSCREFEQEVTAELLEEARDRIAADARRITDLERAQAIRVRAINTGNSKLAAAEARAQRAEYDREGSEMSEYTKEQMAEACERARHAYVPPHVADQLRAAAATLRSLHMRAALAPEHKEKGT